MPAYGGFALKAMQDYFTGKTIKALLVSTTYVQDVDAHLNLSDLPAGYEIAPSGSYVAGGIVAPNVTVTYDAANNRVKVDCDDLTFPAVTGPVDTAGVLFYVSTGTASTSRLLGFDNYGTPVSLSNAILVHTVSADGILTVAV